MFICEFCRRPSQPGEKLTMVPVEFRERDYPDGGYGQEVTKERKACAECAALHANPPGGNGDWFKEKLQTPPRYSGVRASRDHNSEVE